MHETKCAPLECKMSLFSALVYVQPLCPNRVVEASCVDSCLVDISLVELALAK